MATNLQTTSTFYRGSVSPVGKAVGYEPGPSRASVARYQFTTPSTGATSLSFRTNQCALTPYYANEQQAYELMGSVRFNITTDPDVYKNYSGSAGYPASSDGYAGYFSGSININLLPETTYYLWLYPNFTSYAIFYCGDCSELTVDGIYGISSIVATNANIGSSSTITINRMSSVFKDTIQYKIDGQNNFTNLVVKTSENSVVWNVPMSAYDYVSINQKYVNATIKVITYYNNTVVGEKTTTIQLYAVEEECKPEITATFTLLNDVSALTGNNSTAILNYSNVKIDISATGKHGGTIDGYSIVHNGETVSANTATFEKIQVGRFTCRAIDTRGYVAEQVINLTTIPYFIPSVNIATTNPDVTTGATTSNLNGNVFNGSFGLVDNALTVQYRYKVSNGSYSDWITVEATKTNNTYKSVADTITLDYHNTYIFQGRVVDSLSTIESATITVVSIPIFDWSKNDFHFNVPIVLSEGSYGSTLPRNGVEGQIFLKI